MQDRLAEQRPKLLRLEGRPDELDILRGLGGPLRGLRPPKVVCGGSFRYSVGGGHHGRGAPSRPLTWKPGGRGRR